MLYGVVWITSLTPPKAGFESAVVRYFGRSAARAARADCGPWQCADRRTFPKGFLRHANLNHQPLETVCCSMGQRICDQ